MSFNVTAEHMRDNPELNNQITAEMFNEHPWKQEKFNHAKHQWCLNNDVTFPDYFVFWSIVVDQATLDGLVPIGWPNSVDVAEDGTETRVAWKDYAIWREVVGGFLVKFAGERKDPVTGSVISNPTFKQLGHWVSELGGFSTKAEADALFAAYNEANQP